MVEPPENSTGLPSESDVNQALPEPRLRDQASRQLSTLLQYLRIDAGSSQPLYEQLQHQLEDYLHQGTLTAGQGLPAERVLAEALGTSRTVVKRAYDYLREREMVNSRGRAGTILRPHTRIQPEMGRLKGFTQEMQEVGMVPSTRLVSRQIVSDRTMASLFGRPSYASFLHLVRVRLANDKPMTREVAWYDLTLAPHLENWDGHGSAYDYIQQDPNLVLDWAQQSVEATMSDPPEMAEFGFFTPQPCLLLKRRTYTTNGAMAEYAEGVFRGDAYTYSLRLKV